MADPARRRRDGSDAEDGVEDELLALVAVERECGTSADWSLSVADEELTLEIAADGEAVPVVHGMVAGLL